MMLKIKIIKKLYRFVLYCLYLSIIKALIEILTETQQTCHKIQTQFDFRDRTPLTET